MSGTSRELTADQVTWEQAPALWLKSDTLLTLELLETATNFRTSGSAPPPASFRDCCCRCTDRLANGSALQFEPKKAITIKGRAIKYLSPRGESNRLEVHPRNHDRLRDLTDPVGDHRGHQEGRQPRLHEDRRGDVPERSVSGTSRELTADQVTWEQAPAKLAEVRHVADVHCGDAPKHRPARDPRSRRAAGDHSDRPRRADQSGA